MELGSADLVVALTLALTSCMSVSLGHASPPGGPSMQSELGDASTANARCVRHHVNEDSMRTAGCGCATNVKILD